MEIIKQMDEETRQKMLAVWEKHVKKQRMREEEEKMREEALRKEREEKRKVEEMFRGYWRHRFFYSRRYVLEMLYDRGYDISLSDIDLSHTDFERQYGICTYTNFGTLTINAKLISDPSQKVAVFLGGTNLVADLHDIHMQCEKEGFNRVILVLEHNMTAEAQEAIQSFSSSLKVEIFAFTEALQNTVRKYWSDFNSKVEIVSSQEMAWVREHKDELKDSQVLEDGVLDHATTISAIFPSPMNYLGRTEVQWHAKARINGGANFFYLNDDTNYNDTFYEEHGDIIFDLAPGLDKIYICPFCVLRWASKGRSPPPGFMSPNGWKVLVDYYKSLKTKKTLP